jgi:hypothetical protein
MPIVDLFPPPPEKTVTATPVDGPPMRICTHAESDDDTYVEVQQAGGTPLPGFDL